MWYYAIGPTIRYSETWIVQQMSKKQAYGLLLWSFVIGPALTLTLTLTLVLASNWRTLIFLP